MKQVSQSPMSPNTQKVPVLKPGSNSFFRFFLHYFIFMTLGTRTSCRHLHLVTEVRGGRTSTPLPSRLDHRHLRRTEPTSLAVDTGADDLGTEPVHWRAVRCQMESLIPRKRGADGEFQRCFFLKPIGKRGGVSTSWQLWDSIRVLGRIHRALQNNRTFQQDFLGQRHRLGTRSTSALTEKICEAQA